MNAITKLSGATNSMTKKAETDEATRLLRAAESAVRAHPTNSESAAKALVDVAMGDFGMLKEMTARFILPAARIVVQQVLERARKAEAAKKPAPPAGRSIPGVNTSRNLASPPTNSETKVGAIRSSGASGPHAVENHQLNAGRPASSQSRTGLLAGIRALGATAQKTILDTYLVNGKPLGDLTPQEGREASNAAGIRSKFLAAVFQGVPEGKQLRVYARPDEVQKLHDQIVKGYAHV